MSMERILERFSAQVIQACDEGRGKELLERAFAEIAVDHASLVFLKIETEMSKGAPVISHDLFEWAATFPCSCGLDLLNMVESSMSEYHASAAQIADMADIVATAYQGQIDKLFGTSVGGGAA